MVSNFLLRGFNNMFDRVVFSIGRLCDSLYIPLGTCSLINKTNIIVTAAHVVNGSDKNLCIMINNINNGYQDTNPANHSFATVKIKSINPIYDLCVLEIIGTNPVKSNISIATTDEVMVGDNLKTFGFPHSDLGRLVLTYQNTEVGAKIIMYNNKIPSKHMVLNVQARPGQSGSPVLDILRNKLIGILIGPYVPNKKSSIMIGGIDPQTLHQTTHVVSAEYLKEMI